MHGMAREVPCSPMSPSCRNATPPQRAGEDGEGSELRDRYAVRRVGDQTRFQFGGWRWDVSVSDEGRVETLLALILARCLSVELLCDVRLLDLTDSHDSPQIGSRRRVSELLQRLSSTLQQPSAALSDS